MRKKRNKLNWAPILGIVLVVHCLVALGYSAVITPSRVRVVGALPDDEERVTQIMQQLAGTPSTRPPFPSIFEQLSRRPDLRTIDYKVNLFGASLIKLTYERPAAKILNRPGLVLGYDGTIFPRKDASLLPITVKLPALGMDPSMTYAPCYEGRQIASVCHHAQDLGKLDVTVTVSEDGSAALAFGGKIKVELGIPDRLSQKFDRLQHEMVSNPDFLEDSSVVNLVSPEQPVIRRPTAPVTKPTL